MDGRQMGFKKERLSQDPYCCKNKNQRNNRSLEEITEDKVHDSKMLKKMVVNQVLDNSDDDDDGNKIKIKSVLAAGAIHDTNKNFQYLEYNRIIPGIKVRKNSIVSSREITSQGIKKQKITIKGFDEMEEEKKVWI